MAGIETALGNDTGDLHRQALAHRLASRELGRIKDGCRAKGLDSVLIAHIVGCVTLNQGISRASLEHLADAEGKALHRSNGGQGARIADYLEEVLPRTADGEIGPILPDLIGEALAITSIQGPQRAAAVRCYGALGDAMLSSLVRCIDDFPTERAAFDMLEALSEHVRLDVNALSKIDSLLSTRTSLAELRVRLRKLLNACAEDGVVFKDARVGIDRQLDPHGTLNRSAVESAQKAVAFDRRREADWPEMFRSYLGGSLRALAEALLADGRHADAREAVAESISIFRESGLRTVFSKASQLSWSLLVAARISRSLGASTEAALLGREALELAESVFSEFATAYEAHQVIEVALRVAALLLDNSDWGASLNLVARVEELNARLREQPAEAAEEKRLVCDDVCALLLKGDCLSKLRRHAESLNAYKEASTCLESKALGKEERSAFKLALPYGFHRSMICALASERSLVDLGTLTDTAWQVYCEMSKLDFEAAKKSAQETLAAFDPIPEGSRPCLPYSQALLLVALRSFHEGSIDEAVLYSRTALFAYLPMFSLFGGSGGYIATLVEYYEDAYRRAGLAPDQELLEQIKASRADEADPFNATTSVDVEAAKRRALQQGY
jgi:tetratricopeptide (TPR) repeat protein